MEFKDGKEGWMWIDFIGAISDSSTEWTLAICWNWDDSPELAEFTFSIAVRIVSSTIRYEIGPQRLKRVVVSKLDLENEAEQSTGHFLDNQQIAKLQTGVDS